MTGFGICLPPEKAAWHHLFPYKVSFNCVLLFLSNVCDRVWCWYWHLKSKPLAVLVEPEFHKYHNSSVSILCEVWTFIRRDSALMTSVCYFRAPWFKPPSLLRCLSLRQTTIWFLPTTGSEYVSGCWVLSADVYQLKTEIRLWPIVVSETETKIWLLLVKIIKQ